MAGVRSYNYHASAHALSGHLTRPENQLIQVQAGSALPSTGGQQASRVENYRCGESVSFDSAYSHVSGSEKQENGKTIYTTLATTAIENLNILDMVTADRVVTRLAASWDQASGDESRILVLGSRFENLRIAGYEMEVELDHQLGYELDTFAKVIDRYNRNEDFRKMTVDPLSADTLPKKPTLDPHEVVRCSLVRQVRPKTTCPGIQRKGSPEREHVFVVPEFGTIHLAELQLEHGRKTLTMIRVELGSPNGGDVVVGQGSTNGRPPGGGG
jgi:hypothetical protein